MGDITKQYKITYWASIAIALILSGRIVWLSIESFLKNLPEIGIDVLIIFLMISQANTTKDQLDFYRKETENKITYIQ
jgi:hypothetical protein